MSKNLQKSIEENFGLVATFLGFVVDTIALVALVNSKVPPSIPLIEYKLDATFQLTLLIIAIVTYIGFLREKWLRISRKLSTRPESTFFRFLIYDLIVRFKYPFYVIPFVLFCGISFTITTQLNASGWVFLVIIIIATSSIVGIASSVENADKQSEKEWELLKNEQVFGTWIYRIEKEISIKNYVTNVELANLYGETINYSNKAIWQYHREFEVEKNLICVSEDLEKGYGDSKQRLRLWVIAPRNLADSRPWLENKIKYFDYV